jgi:hypothetical protein
MKVEKNLMLFGFELFNWDIADLTQMTRWAMEQIVKHGQELHRLLPHRSTPDAQPLRCGMEQLICLIRHAR